MQSAALDLALLAEAAREAGALARELVAQPLKIESKGEAGPVTNVDFAVNDLLERKLRPARPGYGWLSEESPDNPADRLGKARVFAIDPIDGTAAMIQKSPQFTISIGIIENNRAFAGAIYNPMTDELFVGGAGVPATLNGQFMHASMRTTLDGARMIGPASRFKAGKWPQPWPRMDMFERQSIAYRMALVGAGMAEATLLFGWKNEWDIAAGAAVVEAAGGRVTDLWNGAVVLNNPEPRTPGLVVSGAAVHALLIERTKHLTDPRKGETS